LINRRWINQGIFSFMCGIGADRQLYRQADGYPTVRISTSPRADIAACVSSHTLQHMAATVSNISYLP